MVFVLELKGKIINFLGDSITAGSGVSSPEKRYFELLKVNAELKEARGYGIGGTRFAVQKGTDFRPKDDYVDINSFSERFHQMDDDADAVVIFGGTNDYGHGDAPIGTFDDRTPDTFYGACHYLFSNVIKKYIGKPVIIMTPLHRLGDTKAERPDKAYAYGTLKDYVDIIREVAEYYSLPVLDLFKYSGIQPEIAEIREKFVPDGLHPNDEGHIIIANKLQKFLEQL